MLDAEHFAELFPAELLGERRDAFAQNHSRAVGVELLRQHLAGSERFLTDAVQRAVISILMFDDDQDSAHSTLTSDCSLSTSCAAISAGVPVSIWVSFRSEERRVGTEC